MAAGEIELRQIKAQLAKLQEDHRRQRQGNKQLERANEHLRQQVRDLTFELSKARAAIKIMEKQS